VIDDGSTDDTKDVIQGFRDTRLEYICSENWGGPARPRNIGIKNARGDYIAFCDADDYWMPEKLEKQIPHFKSPDVIGVGSDILRVEDVLMRRKRRPLSQDALYDFNALLLKRRAPLSSLVVRNEGFMFDENEDFKFAEDFEFQLQLTSLTNKKIKVLAEVLTCYRVHAGNASQKAWVEQSSIGVLEKYKNKISPKKMELLYCRNCVNAGLNALRSDKGNAADCFRRALCHARGQKKGFIFLLYCTAKAPRAFVLKLLRAYYYLINR